MFILLYPPHPTTQSSPQKKNEPFTQPSINPPIPPDGLDQIPQRVRQLKVITSQSI